MVCTEWLTRFASLRTLLPWSEFSFRSEDRVSAIYGTKASRKSLFTFGVPSSSSPQTVARRIRIRRALPQSFRMRYARRSKKLPAASVSFAYNPLPAPYSKWSCAASIDVASNILDGLLSRERNPPALIISLPPLLPHRWRCFRSAI